MSESVRESVSERASERARRKGERRAGVTLRMSRFVKGFGIPSLSLRCTSSMLPITYVLRRERCALPSTAPTS